MVNKDKKCLWCSASVIYPGHRAHFQMSFKKAMDMTMSIQAKSNEFFNLFVC